VAGLKGEGAPVSGGVVDGRRGMELQVRCRSGEGESWRGERKNSAIGGGVPFFKRGAMGRQRRGGVGGVGRRVEVERGRARGARARWGNDSAAGSGPRSAGTGGSVAVRQWRGDGVGVTRDNAADRWVGTRRGSVISGCVRG
jgi:hypothetical protein